MATATLTHYNTLHSKIDNRTANIGVIGLGYVGLPTAVHNVRKGYNVTGFDVSDTKVESINQGKNYIKNVNDEDLYQMVKNNELRATNDFTHIQDMDVIVMCVPTPIDEYKNPDLSFVQNATEMIAPHVKKGTLVVFESTTYPGTTEEIIVPILEQQNHVIGEEVFVAYSPERVDPGNEKYGLTNTPKVVGGITAKCTELAGAYVGETAQLVSDVKVAEMSKVYENTFRYINMALVNETAKICHKMGIDIWEVVEASKTKPYGFMPFYPGVGVGGHCIPVDPYYLTYKAKEYGEKTEMIELSGRINDSMRDFVFYRIMELLNEQGKSLKDSHVVVLGVAYKEDIDDVRESPVIPFLEKLTAHCSNVSVIDPYVQKFSVNGEQYRPVEYNRSIIAESDIVVLATSHQSFNYREIANHASVVLDTKNGFAKQDIVAPHIHKL
ncbi:UDP-N-acetyl-D-glucosamine dehydrogenase [Priestia megaterium]|nr:UDP-N-acetyl-D-glucosamine dehydrogenase [Priestia megaterium]